MFILQPWASGALDTLTVSGTGGTSPWVLWVSLHRAAPCLLAAPWTSQQEGNENPVPYLSPIPVLPPTMTVI